MVIMFSYALFGLMALIGLQGLIAHHRKQEEKPAAPPAPSKEEQLLTEIRDLLKEKK